MRLNCLYEQLDDATRNYLNEVRERKGRGTPGIFIARSNPKAILALILGPMFGIILFGMAAASPKDASSTALLQTSGCLIAGWSILYAARRWNMGLGKVQGGNFVYFDPCHIFEVDNERVSITSLETVCEATPFKPDIIRFNLNPAVVSVATGSAKAAEYVANYYDAMDQLERRSDNPCSTAAELGSASKYVVEEDSFPKSTDDLKLQLPDMPIEVRKERSAGFGFVGMFLIIISTAAMYFCFWTYNLGNEDDVLFEAAKDHGLSGLRGYLLDERSKNSPHRDEAKQILAKYYNQATAKIASITEKPVNQKLRDGMVKLLETIRSSDAGVLSMRVTEKDTPLSGGESRAERLLSALSDSMGRVIGPELVAFAKPPDDKAANITIEYSCFPSAIAPNSFDITYRVMLRLSPDEEPFADATWRLNETYTPTDLDGRGVDESVVLLSKEFVGEYKKEDPIEAGGGE